MKLTRIDGIRGGMRRIACWSALVALMMLPAGQCTSAQGVTTTTVQGTVYLANGQPGAGTLVVSWPSFTTAAGQAIVADQLTVTIPADGFVSVSLAANQGATPAGEYYTATYYMSDGSSNTEYWVVPVAAQTTIAQVRSQVMPATEAVQAVTKAYVDESIAELQDSELTASGGTLTGPLTLSADPTQSLEAADKHYVDAQVATAVPLTGGTMTGPLIQSNASTVRNNADAEVDYYLWPGLTTSQKGSFNYTDWNGNNQWSMAKDASNNWELNSAVGGLDSFKAYQSTNGGDTYVDGSTAAGTVRVNYESGSGTAFKVYGGNNTTLYASFTGATPIAFPGLAATSGQSCLQIDTSGNVTNTGSACGSGSGGGSGTVNSSNSGYIAYYPSGGTSIGGLSSVPVTAGGTGATTAAAALSSLGALPVAGGTLTGALGGTSANLSGTVSAGGNCPSGAIAGSICSSTTPLNVAWYGASPSNSDNTAAINNCLNAALAALGGTCYVPPGTYKVVGPIYLRMFTSLMGMSNSLQQTTLKHTGTGGCLISDDPSDSNAAFGSEVAHLSLYGSNTNDIAICLNGDSTAPPQFVNIHDNTITNFPYGFKATTMSYDTLERNTFIGGGTTATSGNTIGLDLEQAAGAAFELSWFKNNSVQGYQEGLRVNGGGQLVFDHNDFAQSPNIGIEIVQNSGLLEFDGDNTINSAIHILFDPGSGQAVSGVLFRDETMYNLTTSQIAIDETGAGAVYSITFQGGGISPGSPEPTTSINLPNILVEASSLVFDGFEDGTTGAHNINAMQTSGIDAFDKRLSGFELWDGKVSTQSLASSAGSGYLDGYELWGYEPISGSSYFHAQGIQWTGGACPYGLPGMAIYGDNLANSGTSRNNSYLPMTGCISNPNPSDNSSGNLYGTTFFGAYFADEQSGQPGFVSNPASGDSSSGDAWRGFAPGTSTINYEVTKNGDEKVNSLSIGSNMVVPSAVTGYHGSSGTKVQLSDGTGSSGNLAQFASDGSLTNGPAPPASAIAGISDTQTLTNKSIAGGEVNSGAVSSTYGGTGQNESSATGIGQWSAGTYSVSNSITPSTVTATGLVTGANDTTLTTSTTMTNSWTTTGLVLPAVPASTTKSGRCVVYWQMSSTSYTATFGLGMNSAPTDVWGGSSVTYAAAGTSNWKAFTQQSTTTTAISTAATAGATSTTYRAEIDFTIQTGSTSPVTMTIYGETSNASGTLTIEPGSACYWLP